MKTRLFRRFSRIAAAALLAAGMIAPGTAGAQQADRKDDPDFVTAGAGVFDFNDNRTSGMGALEYRSDKKFLFLKPFAGINVNFDYGGMVYAGVLMDIYLGRRLVVTPNFAPGFYWEGDGKDLGYPLEFRSGIEVSYRFDNRSRLGIAVHHISNASISDNNPGTETVMLVYSHPFGDMFGR